VAVYCVHGERRVEHGNSEIRMGKQWLVSRLQALAQTGRLHLPKTPEAEAARKELQDYEIKISDDGSDTYGVFRTGKHDDLVTAFGLATQPPPGHTEFYGVGSIGWGRG
jgi:hypothetical protein